MSLKVTKKFKWKGINWKSGYFYTFRYNAYRSDPTPVIILMYKITGINHTGHQWRLIQGINFNYIPRNHRKIFIKLWKSEMQKNKGNVELTWDNVQFRFPYLELAVRRYVIKPNYRIQHPQEIPFDKLDDVVISTWGKDFSKKLKMDLAAKKSRAIGRGDTLKNKYKNKWGGLGSSFFSFAKNLFK